MIALPRQFFSRLLPRRFEPRLWIGMGAFVLMLAAFVCSLDNNAVAEVTPALKLQGFNLECLRGMPGGSPSTVETASLDGMLTARAVACTYEMVTFAQEKVVAPIARTMMPVASATILLAFVLFGLRLTLQGGVERPFGDAFVLIFRASVVMMLLLGLSDSGSGFNLSRFAMLVQNELLDWTQDAFKTMINLRDSQLMKECVRMQDTYVDQAGNGAFKRNYSVTTAHLMDGYVTIRGTKISIGVWKVVDCLAGLLIGVAAGVVSKVALFSMVLAMLSSGPLGIACFVGFCTFFIMLLAMLIRAVFIVMQAYLAIAVIMMFLPLVIPTIMFRRTWSYFTNYVAMYTGIIFQPVIMIMFMALAVNCMGLYLVGNEKDFGGTQKPSSETYNPNEIYSLWQLFAFDIVDNTNDRINMLEAMIEFSPGKKILSLEGMAALDLWGKYAGKLNALTEAMSNPFNMETHLVTQPDGSQKEVTQRVVKGKDDDYWKKMGEVVSDININDISNLLKLHNVGSRDGNQSIANAQNYTGTTGMNALTLPYLKLDPGGTYDKYLQNLYIKKKSQYGALGEEHIVTDPATGEIIYEDDGVTAKREYNGTHPWYARSKIDNNFRHWFLRKMFSAVFCLLLMVYIFFSLNESVPEITRGITESAAYAMGPSGGGSLGGVPGLGSLEKMMREGGDDWSKRFKALSGDTSNPGNRTEKIAESGRDMLANRLEPMRNSELGGLVSGAVRRTTGKDEE